MVLLWAIVVNAKNKDQDRATTATIEQNAVVAVERGDKVKVMAIRLKLVDNERERKREREE